MDGTAPEEAPEGIAMPVETISLAAAGKYLLGVILIPWIWYERKRVDRLTQILAEQHYTKAEVKEKIEDKLAPIQTDVEWIRRHLENK